MCHSFLSHETATGRPQGKGSQSCLMCHQSWNYSLSLLFFLPLSDVKEWSVLHLTTSMELSPYVQEKLLPGHRLTDVSLLCTAAPCSCCLVLLLCYRSWGSQLCLPWVFFLYILVCIALYFFPFVLQIVFMIFCFSHNAPLPFYVSCSFFLCFWMFNNASSG